MKKYIVTLLLASLAVAKVNAQNVDTSVVIKKKTTTVGIDSEGVRIRVGSSDTVTTTTITTVTKEVKTVTPTKYPKVNFGFNFEHFDIGLSKYHIGSDFGLPAGYEFLDHDKWKTHTIGFDVLQFGLRLNHNFKIMLAAGLDWNHMSLKNDNVTIIPDHPILDYVDNPTAELKKNRFSSRYVRLPLYFEYRTNKSTNSERFSVVFGPEVGFLIDGKVKQKTKSGEKTKVKDDYNFNDFRYGANVRLGYGSAGVFFKYYFNDVFAKNTAPGLEDYKNLSFGLTFGF